MKYLDIHKSFDLLVGKSETDLLASKIEMSVISSDEDVTENDGVSEIAGEIHTSDTEQARVTVLDDIVAGRDFVVISAQSDLECGVLFSVGAVQLGREASGDFVEPFLGADDKGSSGVDDGHHVVLVEGLAAHFNSVHIDDPVGVVNQRNVGEGGGVEGRVNTAQNEGGAVGASSGAQEEGEGRILDESLLDHVLEGSGGEIGGDVLESHTEDTVELSSDEGKTVELVHLGEGLGLDNDASHIQIIGVFESGARSRSVLDGKLSAVGLEGGALA